MESLGSSDLYGNAVRVEMGIQKGCEAGVTCEVYKPVP